MFGLVRLRGVRLATPEWRWQISRGFVGFSALFAYFHAIALLPLATAVTLNYTSPGWRCCSSRACMPINSPRA